MSAPDPAPTAPGPNRPYGGTLVDLIVDPVRAAEMKAGAKDIPSLTLDERRLCDLELLAVGAYSPLRSFLGRADRDRVVGEWCLADGTPWPLPITLPVEPAAGAEVGKPLALRDVFGNLLAFLHVEELYPSYGEADPDHLVSGRLEVIRVPPRLDFVFLRRTPQELRRHIERLGWSRVVAFQPREPIHRADEERIRRAAERICGGLLIQPVVGAPKPGDIDHSTRIRCFQALVDNHFDPGSAILNLLPFDARGGGPREAMLRAIVARNYGGTHFVVAPDLAGTDEGREAIRRMGDELGIAPVNARPMVYLPDRGGFAAIDEVPPGARTAALSEAQVRDDYLARGLPLPEWFARPAVAAILNEANPPKSRQGLTIWFTGLSGSGKSTVAHALVERLAEFGRHVSMLDGDEIRTHLSKGLGFSKEDRDANIHRVGYVAGLISRHGGTTLCSVVSPYRAPRDRAREASGGNFVEVYCETPIEVCEARDVKGFYAKARDAAAAGRGMGFTGVDDPYEPPLRPEVAIDTSKLTVEESADAIVRKLIELGYILPHGHTG